MNFSINSVLALIGVGIYGLLILPVALRWRQREKAILHLTLYLVMGVLWSASSAAISFRPPQLSGQLPFLILVPPLAQLILSLALGALTLSFLDQPRFLRLYWLGTISLVVVWAGLALNVYNVGNLLLTSLPALGSVGVILSGLSIFIWSIVTAVALGAIYHSLQTRRQSQFRNRLRYWLGGIMVLAVADILLFWPNPIPLMIWVAYGLRLAGAVLITYIVASYHPPDLKIVFNQLLRSTSVTVILSLVFLGALSLAYFLNRWNIAPQNVVLLMAGLSLGLGFIIPSLSRWLDKGLSRALFGEEVNEEITIKAYSQNVGSDWNLEKLCGQALQFILQEMKVKRGAIFLDQGDAAGHLTLKMISSVGVNQVEAGYFVANDPWVIHLRQEKTSITQYDLDILPAYRTMDAAAKAWLGTLEMEIFFPIILRQRELIGVLTLDYKANRTPYLPHDLTRLNVLTSQTAIDIDKAKMFAQLGSVNQKLGDLSSKFESFDKGKTDFLSIASHELRTPLTQIHGYASMLMEATEDDLQNPAYLQNVFNGIARGSGRLKDVVDLIFDVSKVEIGELALALGPVLVKEVVKQATLLQEKGLEERKQKLIVSGLDQLPIIQADVARLVQAVNHLLNNAIKYTPDQGTITITGRLVTEENVPDKVELIVTDTGIGIDPVEHERIFDKFYRVGDVMKHSTGSVKFKGAGPGLGLSLVAGIAKAHYGKVWVESPRYDEATCPGSQFHFVIPVDPNQADKQEQPTQEAAKPSSKAETRHWRSGDIKMIKDKLTKQRGNQ